MQQQKEIIDKIIGLEWAMFTNVNQGNSKASCQEDPRTFKAMRAAQFECWSNKALESYLQDLQTAKGSGHNLVEAKYVYMMIKTNSELSQEYQQLFPVPSPEVQGLAKEILAITLHQTAMLHKQYPLVAKRGRPLLTSDENSGVTSIETYQYGELLTYSESTLKYLLADIQSLTNQNQSYVEKILINTVQFYGYQTLAEAEAAA